MDHSTAALSIPIATGQLAAALIISAAGISHVRKPAMLAHALRQGFRPWVLVAVIAWGAVEVATGVGVMLGLADPDNVLATPARACGATIAAGYLAFLLRSRFTGRQSCACTSRNLPINVATIVRAGAMGVAFLGSNGTSLLAASDLELAAIIMTAFSLGLLGWIMPETLVSLTARQRVRVSP